jgi:DNA primase
MARIPEAEVQRLKDEVAVQRLVEAAGIELKRVGKDLAGRCPFHEDSEPSLIVTPGKNLWHCFGCQVGGGPIDWVMKLKGVSFRHAVELLKDESSLAAVAGEPVKRTTVRALPAPVALDADDRALLLQVVDYYHQTLQESPEAHAYLAQRGLDHPQLVDHFKLGFANRTLGLRLPESNRKSGGEIRERLQRVGVLRDSGHEHFNGSLVIPVFDEAGQVREVYGRKVGERLRAGTPMHLYLPAHEERGRGVFNVQALAAAKEVILCESLIDALTFWCAGYRNVTTAYGIEGFTPELLAAFKDHGTQRVLIAFDRDDAGERGAAKVAEQLMQAGIECYRIEFPKGMDANEYALKVQPAAKSLGILIRKALWLGKGKPPERAAVLPVAMPAEVLPSRKTADQEETQEPQPDPAGIARSSRLPGAARAVARSASACSGWACCVHFKLGFANRTLGLRLPESNRQ